MTTAITATSTLLLVTVITETLSYCFPKVGAVVNGRAGHGRDSRVHALRQNGSGAPEPWRDPGRDAQGGLEWMEQVTWAVLYPDGTVAVVPWEPPGPGQEGAGETTEVAPDLKLRL